MQTNAETNMLGVKSRNHGPYISIYILQWVYGRGGARERRGGALNTTATMATRL